MQPAPGSVSTFTPTLAQRNVPKHDTHVSDPADCSNQKIATSSSIHDVAITYNDDGTVFYIHAGTPVR